jgi:hypothetical protein
MELGALERLSPTNSAGCRIPDRRPVDLVGRAEPQKKDPPELAPLPHGVQEERVLCLPTKGPALKARKKESPEGSIQLLQDAIPAMGVPRFPDPSRKILVFRHDEHNKGGLYFFQRLMQEREIHDEGVSRCEAG